MKCTPEELQLMASLFRVSLADTEEGGADWGALRYLIGDFTSLLEKIADTKINRQKFLDESGCYDYDDDKS